MTEYGYRIAPGHPETTSTTGLRYPAAGWERSRIGYLQVHRPPSWYMLTSASQRNLTTNLD